VGHQKRKQKKLSKQNQKETPQWAETKPQEIMLVRDDLATLLCDYRLYKAIKTEWNEWLNEQPGMGMGKNLYNGIIELG